MEKTNKQIENGNPLKTPWIQSVIIIIIIFGTLAGFLYWQVVKDNVFIENSYLDAPIANIAPTASGMLNAVYVKEGDRILPNTPIALVGSETLYSKEGGIITSAPEVLGSYYSVGQTVISIVDDSQMKVIGSIEETKGLKKIVSGDSATFTVDAYPGKKYEGIVDQISSVSESNSVIFSISDKRAVRKFDVSVRFDHNKYPELKSGMSAKITINTKI
jgi:multidrug resistance efflux pump